jgi:hypothetical protein
VKVNVIRPQYVESFPGDLEDGVLYISRKFRTACHRCCCGCGTKIITPIRPTEYRLTEREGLVSLHPSVGNWNHPCESHYVIRDNCVLWAEGMTKAAIARGRAFDEAEKAQYFSQRRVGWWRNVWGWITRLFT